MGDTSAAAQLRSRVEALLDDCAAHVGEALLSEVRSLLPEPAIVLGRELDALLDAPTADCPICECEGVVALAALIRAVGGAVTDEQREAIEDLVRRADEAWIPFDDAPSPPAARVARPARNAPCHCGSGKKYKKCHLEADSRRLRH